MKKFLSLVLALVMTMSLVTISAGAEFTDDSAVDYSEAVDVISTLGIVGGYPDGSFKPQNTLTRGAAAKIICNLMLGTKVAGQLPSIASYSDVPAGSTYAPYIAYLKSEGVVGGYADGTFKPGNTLTGYAFLKMLLGAQGYDAAAEGLSGDGWQISVAKLAKENGLYDGNDSFNGNLAATREEACLYALNTLKAVPKKYEGGSTVTINGIAITTGADLKDGDDPFVYYTNFSKLTCTEDTFDAMGRPATAYAYNGESIGTYAKAADATYTKKVDMKTVYTALGLSGSTNIFTIDEDDAYRSSVNVIKDKDTNLPYSANGVVVEVYKDAKKVVVINPTVAKVTKVTAAKDDVDRYITLNSLAAAPMNFSSETFTTEEFAKNDIVMVQYNGTDVASVKPLEKLTGKITKIAGSGTSAKYTIDGVEYKLSASKGADLNAVAVKDTVDFYLDEAGYICKIDVAESAAATVDTVAFVEYAAPVASGDYNASNTYKATLRYADGTSKVVETKDDYSAYISQVVKFSTNNKGKVVLEDDADSFYTYAGASVKNGRPVMDDAGVFSLSSKTTFVVVDKDSDGDYVSKVYTGFNAVPTVTGASAVSFYAKDGDVKVVFVYDGTQATANDELSYIVIDPKATLTSDADNSNYYEAVMIEDGEAKTVQVKNTAMAAAATAASLAGDKAYAVAISGYTVTDGVITALTVKTTDVVLNASKIEAGSDNAIKIGGSTKSYDSKTVVWLVNEDFDAAETVAIEDIAEGDVGDIYTSITYILNEKNNLKVDTIILLAK